MAEEPGARRVDRLRALIASCVGRQIGRQPIQRSLSAMDLRLFSSRISCFCLLFGMIVLKPIQRRLAKASDYQTSRECTTQFL